MKWLDRILGNKSYESISKRGYCKRGHERTEENTYSHTRKSGRVARSCITCNKLRRIHA